jgi:hypothetical protein
MQKYKATVLISAAACLLASAGLAQSLGDAARQERQKKPSKNASTARRVITDDDMPQRTAGPAAATSSPSNQPAGQASPAVSQTDGQPPASAEVGALEQWTRAGSEWKARILAQKAKIESMQTYLEKVKASVHFASKNADYDATLVNVQALEKLQEAKRLEKQLEGENTTLQNMQQAAQDAGYDASIYDPQKETGNSSSPSRPPQN